MMKPLLVIPQDSHLTGNIRIPGDKSISHRALILGALSAGESFVSGLLESHDVLATAEALRLLGAVIERRDDGVYRISGRGTGGLIQPDEDLDFGNSGTGARLMMGVVAGHPLSARFTGDHSLSCRPMGRVLEPLKQMGASIEDGRDTLPLILHGASSPIPVTYRLPVPSAQVKSAILLAGLNTPGRTTVIEPVPTRDHTERMLRLFGARIEVHENADGEREIALHGEAELVPQKLDVPGDPSSAAFPAIAALIKPGSDIMIENVMMNPARDGLFITLEEMGARIEKLNPRTSSGETVVDLRVRSSRLMGIDVPAGRAPSMIDEYPALAIAAAYAQGTTRMAGLAELRVKESDRLAAIYQGLKACGIECVEGKDDLSVTGSAHPPGGATIKTFMDHRIAMAFLMLGLNADNPVTVDDGSMIATSFPGFISLMSRIGAEISPGEIGI